jgi:hypothetical protein
MLLVEAVKRREEDKDFWTHYLAWQTMRANGKKKSGRKLKMAFPKFMDFYKRKTEAAVNGTKKSRFSGLSDYLHRRKEAKIEDGG